MRKSVFSEFNDYVNGLKKRILELKSKLDRKYVLSQKEIDFLKQYADVTSSLVISDKIVSPAILDKKRRYDDIFNSIRVFAYYESLSKEDKIDKLEKIIVESTEAIRSKIYDEIATSEKNDSSFSSSERYMKLMRNLSFLDANKSRMIAEICSDDDKKINGVISELYCTDASFYEWYKKMALYEEKNMGFVYAEHVSLCSFYGTQIGNNENLLEMNSNLSERLQHYMDIIADFSLQFLDFNIEECIGKEKKKIFFGKRKELNNLEDLMKLFSEFTKLPGGVEFIKLYSTEDIINVEKCFMNYFHEVYGSEVTYVEPKEFIKRLSQELLWYYKDEVACISKRIENTQGELRENNNQMNRSCKRLNEQAQLQYEIYNETLEDVPSISGITGDEAVRIFEDMREYLIDGFTYMESVTVPYEGALRKTK